MDKNPMVIPGCLLKKFSPERMIQGVRLEDYCKDDCRICGFNVLEEARRKQLLRSGGLVRGANGLKRLQLGEETEERIATAPEAPRNDKNDEEVEP